MMSFLSGFLLLLLFSHLLSSSASSDISVLFDTWCKEHGKSYRSAEERSYRLQVFRDNYEFVKKHNEIGNNITLYSLDLNALADLTHNEFKASRLGLSAAFKSYRRRFVSLVGDAPPTVDWRQQGAVTNVKDQGSCGACWSFSATGAIEGINKIVTGSLISLSEQELIDCDRTYDSGCEGGLMDYAFQFIIDNKGIDTEEDYPYLGKDKSCNKQKVWFELQEKRRVVTIDDYVDVPSGNEAELQKAVAKQPVSVGVCGSDRGFQLYSKGIFNGPCSTSLDHAILIVGYGSENGVDYWIAKNSWGTRWGMNGYIHMARNTGSSQGVCGINMLASYPEKKGPNPPAPPPPGPTKCDLFTSCAEGETCCCKFRFLGICFSWKCCEMNSAVCCKDKHHCCPQDYPVCDATRNLCLKTMGNGTIMQAVDAKRSSKLGSWSTMLEAWIMQ
ncbi:Probable cysteine protease RD21B [Linum perenne]